MVSIFPNPRPVIGISGSNADSASVRAMMTQITSTGAVPLFIGNHAARDPVADFQKIDALVVMGNNADIDPTKYGEKPHTKTLSEMQTAEGRARADYEEKLLTLALRNKMPVLGVCGGMQRLNVMLGGNLHQHVPDLVGNDDHAQQDFGIAPFVPVQLVHIDEKSNLAKIANKNGETHFGDTLLSLFVPSHKNYDYAENSMHHQAVRNVGQGLRVAARSEDGIIEAIEAAPNGDLKDQFVLGVQWHPEFSASELGAKIATQLTQKALRYAKDNQREHPPGEAQDETALSSLPQLKTPSEAVSVAPGGWVETMLRRRGQMPQGGGIAR